jgi:hypothetical protein
MATFTYTFEELPLAIVNGIEAGLVNGQAEISYRGDNWYVTSIADITLEGFGERVNGVRQWPQVACPPEIAHVIRRRLENEWSSRVDDAVSAQLDRDREDAADYRADRRREERMGL